MCELFSGVEIIAKLCMAILTTVHKLGLQDYEFGMCSVQQS
jgi:hypothetical protein